jgi:precorrin-6B methylase 2
MQASIPFSLGLALIFVSPAFSQPFKNGDTLAPDYPTPQAVVDRMLEDARTKPGEMVYDLGCGDGRIVITAAQKFKARALGIELSRDIYDKTAARIKNMGLADRVTIVQGNVLHYDLSPADVVTLYLMTSSNERLRPALERYLKPGARVVSHDFEIRGWKPSLIEKLQVDGRLHTIYVYEIKPNR